MQSNNLGKFYCIGEDTGDIIKVCTVDQAFLFHYDTYYNFYIPGKKILHIM